MKTADNRPDPDKLLASINEEEEIKKRGKLKIFFGMSPGVGKTYTMLQTAHSDLSKGVDVVVGYVESHNRPETNALLGGLQVIPRKKTAYKGTVLEEMDLEAILLRHPYLVLVDELAHTNAAGSYHAKRYQDVQELLDNGINVYTTVNIQHLESKNDTVEQITGITVRETVPDEIFETADEVELIDVTPNTLLDRLAEGKVYAPSQSKEAVRNFFRKGNITALREMSLRLVADRVDKQLKTYMQQKQIKGPWKSGMHLLVLVGSSKSSAKLIRWAKNLSYTMGADLIALHIENTQVLNESQQEQLSKNIDLARRIGAEVIITSGNDLVSRTMEIARKENITHIIIGKSGRQSFLSYLFTGDNFVNRLLKESGEIDIYIIEPGTESRQYRKKLLSHPDFSSSYKSYLFAVLTVLITVVLCIPLPARTGYQSISFILLFAVLLLSMFFRLGPVMLASVLSAVVWNFFFIPPQYTLKITQPENLLTFCMFFAVALVTGTLTSKVRKQERLTRKREEKTNALFLLTNQLAGADNPGSIIRIAKENIKKYFDVDTFFLLQDGSGKLKEQQPVSKSAGFSESERSIAQWVHKHSKKAGNFTDTLSSSRFTFYPLKGMKTKPGVAIVQTTRKFNGETELFWETFLTQISNTLEHHYFAQLAKKAHLPDESDKPYKTLFNFISQPHINWCDVKDLFNRVTDRLKTDLQAYRPDLVIPPSMPLVKLDAWLMEQALFNLVYNSCQYSRPGTTIRLKAFYDNGSLVIQEMDRRAGFPPDTWRTSRGAGSGLSVTKRFVEAHKGVISIENRQNGGIRFTIKIPTEISYTNT